MARDDEMTVSVPPADLPEALEGLVAIQKHGHGLPLALTMYPEYPMPPAYAKIGEMVGMPWVKPKG